MTNQENLERLTKMYDSPSNGLCICSGSLGADPANNVAEILRYFGERERVNFVHARNIKITGEKSFVESGHLSEDGSIDMYEYVRALSDVDYQGPIRPDHGRMISGRTRKAGLWFVRQGARRRVHSMACGKPCKRHDIHDRPDLKSGFFA